MSMAPATDLQRLQCLLRYQFNDPQLLEKAITHSSYTNAKGSSFQRLAFLGDAVLGLAVTNHFYQTYSNLRPGALTKLYDDNVSTEKFARVAVLHNLYSFVRSNDPQLDEYVKNFTNAILHNPVDDGTINASDVLADIVESIAAAVYLDCGSDIKTFWGIFRPLLEPIGTPSTFQGNPVSVLNEFCPKHGKDFKIKTRMEGKKHIADVFVDGKLMASACSEQNKDVAKRNAAKEALRKLRESDPSAMKTDWQTMAEDQEEEGEEPRMNGSWVKSFFKYGFVLVVFAWLVGLLSDGGSGGTL